MGFIMTKSPSPLEGEGLGMRGENHQKLSLHTIDVFVTADQNLQYQQNIAYSDVGVIVIVAINNRLETLLPCMLEVNNVVQTIMAGQVIDIGDGML
ncbi:MAG: hypothetical protein KAX40_02855 [Herpetosiphon sp.]|nr:hypothetical protein [Herpetosiphon sp.]